MEFDSQLGHYLDVLADDDVQLFSLMDEKQKKEK
jgi:hypothetical protein